MSVMIQEMYIQDHDEVRALWQESEGIELSGVDQRMILLASSNGIRDSALWPATILYL